MKRNEGVFALGLMACAALSVGCDNEVVDQIEICVTTNACSDQGLGRGTLTGSVSGRDTYGESHSEKFSESLSVYDGQESCFVVPADYLDLEQTELKNLSFKVPVSCADGATAEYETKNGVEYLASCTRRERYLAKKTSNYFADYCKKYRYAEQECTTAQVWVAENGWTEPGLFTRYDCNCYNYRTVDEATYNRVSATLVSLTTEGSYTGRAKVAVSCEQQAADQEPSPTEASAVEEAP